MKFHRPLSDEERSELSLFSERIAETKKQFMEIDIEALSLNERRMQNLRELVEIKEKVESADVDAIARNTALWQSQKQLDGIFERLERKQSSVVKKSTPQTYEMWDWISRLGREMELAWTEKIALQNREYFTRKDEALHLASQTQTIRDIAFYLAGNRGPFGVVSHGWERGMCETALVMLSTVVQALLEGGEVVPPITPFPLEDAETEEEAA